MKYLICTVMFLVAGIASADSLVLNMTSHHTGTISESNAEHYGLDKYNEINVGVGYGFDLNDTAMAEIGFYENSYKERSVYGYLGLDLNKTAMVDTRLDVGIVDYDIGVIPFARVAFTIGPDDIPIKPEIGVTVDKQAEPLLTFALRFYFND